MRNRKVQVSLSLDSDLISALDDRFESEDWDSRSQLIQNLIRRGQESECQSCESLRILVNSEAFDLPEGLQMPLDVKTVKAYVDKYEPFDKTRLQTRKKSLVRTKERMIIQTVRDVAAKNHQGIADLNQVLDECTNYDLSIETAKEMIERMVIVGKLLRPRGIDTLMVA